MQLTFDAAIRFSILAILATAAAGCQETPEDVSFGIDGSSFVCESMKCDVVFFIDNQQPHPVRIEYRAKLSRLGGEVILDFSDEIEIPARERFKVSRTVSVSEHPERLRVTVTTLQGL